ncbi:MAG: hypothetical protein ACYC99_05470 [Candidatus Geothermincolia bacterium]
MNKRMLGNVLAVIALLCFITAIIGMAIGGSHRWVEPLEELGWIFFTGCVLILYLVVGPAEGAGPLRSSWANAAWAFGALTLALLITAFIANVAAVQYKYWFEAIDTAGLVCMVVTIISAVMARGGFGPGPGSS